MSKEYGPGSESGKHEAMIAMFGRNETRFTELFLAGKGHEEKGVDCVFVFYHNADRSELVELNEVVEPVFTSYQVQREVVVYDVEVVDGLYRVDNSKHIHYGWVPAIGLESSQSAEADLNSLTPAQYEFIRSISRVPLPEQDPNAIGIFRGIASVHTVLHRDLQLIDQSELFRPETY